MLMQVKSPYIIVLISQNLLLLWYYVIAKIQLLAISGEMWYYYMTLKWRAILERITSLFQKGGKDANNENRWPIIQGHGN